jgi:hypothetical protein
MPCSVMVNLSHFDCDGLSSTLSRSTARDDIHKELPQREEDISLLQQTRAGVSVWLRSAVAITNCILLLQ